MMLLFYACLVKWACLGSAQSCMRPCDHHSKRLLHAAGGESATLLEAIPRGKHEAYAALLYTPGNTLWSNVHRHTESLQRRLK